MLIESFKEWSTVVLVLYKTCRPPRPRQKMSRMRRVKEEALKIRVHFVSEMTARARLPPAATAALDDDLELDLCSSIERRRAQCYFITQSNGAMSCCLCFFFALFKQTYLNLSKPA